MRQGFRKFNRLISVALIGFHLITPLNNSFNNLFNNLFNNMSRLLTYITQGHRHTETQ